MSIEATPSLALCLMALLALALGWSMVGCLSLGTATVTAAVRAGAQLTLVSLIIVAALSHPASAIALVIIMYAVAVATTSRRCLLGSRWPWAALAMAVGILPVLAVVFASGAIPLAGAAIIPVCSIIVGNAMTGHTLLCRRSFDHLRDEYGLYESALSIGLTPNAAIAEVIQRRVPEALIPNLDQTRTAGIVSLPGAFVGVLLGGGTPLQAAAAQILVLFGMLAAQAGTVVAASWLMAAGRLLPRDLVTRLGP